MRSIFVFLFFLGFNGIESQTLNWAKAFGGPTGSVDWGQALTVDSIGNSYTLGCFLGVADFDPGPSTYYLNSNSGNLFLLKLDPLGNFLWAKNFGSGSTTGNGNSGSSITIDRSGNIYMCGFFESTGDFNPGIGTFNMTAATANGSAFILKLNSSGNFLWAKSLGQGSCRSVGQSISCDYKSNIYLSGIFNGSIDFDPGIGVYNLFANGTWLTMPPTYRAFILKLDSAGNFKWVKDFGGTGTIDGTALKVDTICNIYMTGEYTGTNDLDPGPGTFTLSSNPPNSYLLKIDSVGVFNWVRNLSGNATIRSYAIDVDHLGNAYITGGFTGTVDFNYGGPSSYTLSSGGPGPIHIFIAKYNSTGGFNWARNFGNNNQNFGLAITLDKNANVYTAGSMNDTIDFDPGLGVNNLYSQFNSDCFVSILDSTGTFVWAKSFGDSGSIGGYSIKLDFANNIYTTGLFIGHCDFDPEPGYFDYTSNGFSDIFVHKMSQLMVGLKENSSSKSIFIAPNPTNGLISIRLDVESEIFVYNPLGLEIFNERKSFGKLIINLSYQPSGLYYVKIIQGQKQYIEKIIKE